MGELRLYSLSFECKVWGATCVKHYMCKKYMFNVRENLLTVSRLTNLNRPHTSLNWCHVLLNRPHALLNRALDVLNRPPDLLNRLLYH